MVTLFSNPHAGMAPKSVTKESPPRAPIATCSKAKQHAAQETHTTKEDDAAKLFKKPLEELATPTGGLEEKIAQLTLKVREMEEMESRLLASMESKVDSVNEVISDKLDSMVERIMGIVVKNGAKEGDDLKAKVKAGKEKAVQGAGGSGGANAQGASSPGWAADHPTEPGAEKSRDGGYEEREDPAKKMRDFDTMARSRREEQESSVRRRTGKSEIGSPGSVSDNRWAGDPDSDPSDDDSSDSDDSDGSSRARGRSNRRHKRSKSSRGRDSGHRRYESRSSVRKIVKDEFRSTVENIGDPKFALYKKNWNAMTRDYKIRERNLVRFMNHLFDGDVLLVYQNVREEHPDATSAEIWKLMSVVCYNSNHQAAVRDKVFRPKYDSKTQSVEDYGNSIKTSALVLGYRIPERQLIDQFEHGLPPNLEKHATGLSGTFDEVVAMTAKYERACKRGNESFRVVGEGGRELRRPWVLDHQRTPGATPTRSHVLQTRM